MSQRNRLLLLAFVGFAILLISSMSFAHGGGLDSDGGHVDSSTGKYHCHSNACATGQPSNAVAEANCTYPDQLEITVVNIGQGDATVH